MTAMEKIMDSFVEELLKNHNLAKEEEQRNLLTKEDYIEMLKPALQIIENNQDASIEEIREELYKYSGVEETVSDAINNKKMAPGAVITYGTKKYQEVLTAGSKDDNEQNLITGFSLYDLASVTKLFTSISIQILAAGNKIDLNKKVNYYLPDFPGLKDVTVYQLLTFNAPVKTDGRVDTAKDREEALVHPVIKLSIWYKLLEKIYENELEDGYKPYFKRRHCW